MHGSQRLASLVGLPSVLLLAMLLAVPAGAFLRDTFAAGPGFPNRVDDHIDSLNMVNPWLPVDIIVDFCSTPMPADSTFLASYGTVYEVFRFIDAIAVRGVTVANCYAIANYPRVKLIEWDWNIYPHLDVSACAIQARGSATYPYPMQAAWSGPPLQGTTGSGITVAVIDSGVDDQHPALAGKFVAGFNAFTGVGGTGVNPDDDWVGWYHGTAVAGMIMANDPTGQYMGVAPNARLVDVKIFDPAGSSPASRTVAAIRWVMQNAAALSIDVANMSFGGFNDDGTDAVSRAANALAAAGVMVVASAGNNPTTTGVSSPGAGDFVVCIGGVDDQGTVSRFDDLHDPVSKVGPRASPPPSYVLSFNDLKPEVCGYMGSITTCQGSNLGQGGVGFWQHPGNGTSWATAHASGVVALILEKFPGMPQPLVRSLLRTTAEARGGATFPTVDPVWNWQYGWGIISAAGAVNTPMPPIDVSVKPWIPGTWNSASIWAGHYPVMVGDPNSLNARIFVRGGAAPGASVLFETMSTGWGAPWIPVGTVVVNVPWDGNTVATLPYTPPQGMEGHKCFRVTVTFAGDTNPTNNSARENIDVQPAHKAAAVVASGGGAAAQRQAQRYAFPVTMCVEPTAPFPFRTAAACICTKDLPPGADAWLEPEPPFDLAPGQCQACSLIVFAPEGVSFSPGDAVHVNGWFWGNGVAEGGVTVYFVSVPPMDATVAEVQYTDDPLGRSPLEGQTVRLSGVATTDSGTYPDRVAVQDGTGPWSGIFVDDPGTVLRGDLVTVTGTVSELGGLTGISPVSDLVIEGGGNPLPEPESLSPGVIGGSESYEGVLVETENVVVTDNADPDNWEITSTGSCRVGHWAGYLYTPFLGDELNVTGVVGSLEDLLKLQPRDDEDIQPATGVPSEGPAILSLSQNAPNPFVRATGISYALPTECGVLLEVYNVAGKVVRTLVDGRQPAGEWTIAWDGMDDHAKPVSSGVYFYSLTAGGRTVGKRMVLIE